MYEDNEYYLEPEQELDFETEAQDPTDTYRFTDTLTLNESAAD